MFPLRFIAMNNHLFVIVVYLVNVLDDNENINNWLCESNVRNGSAANMMNFK